MNNDAIILRKLAYKYSVISSSERNSQNIKLHKAVNDLKQIRPVVLIDELPWSEMNIDDMLTLQCKDAFLREAEWFLRSSLFKSTYFAADTVFPNYIPVNKVIKSTGIGISVEEDILPTSEENHIVSHKYKDMIKNQDDLDKINMPAISYDKAETMRRYEMLGEILADILPIKLAGIGAFNVGPWDDIARYRGVENLLLDLADNPEFMHKIVRKLTDVKLKELEQYERLGLFDPAPVNLHCTAAYTDALPGSDFDGMNVTRKDIWGRGFAQIFASVSKAMHDEFDIQYMIETVGQCGLVYYGCCEPLDKKIDIVRKIPNLRKISITPWADVDIAAEAIGGNYVLSSKPNPASVAETNLDINALKKELGKILNACRKNGSSCDIVLKDISSCNMRPQNIFEWEQVAMDMVRNY